MRGLRPGALVEQTYGHTDTFAIMALLSMWSVEVSAAIAAAAILRWPSAPGLRSSFVRACQIFAAVSVVISPAMFFA